MSKLFPDVDKNKGKSAEKQKQAGFFESVGTAVADAVSAGPGNGNPQGSMINGIGSIAQGITGGHGAPHTYPAYPAYPGQGPIIDGNDTPVIDPEEAKALAEAQRQAAREAYIYAMMTGRPLESDRSKANGGINELLEANYAHGHAHGGDVMCRTTEDVFERGGKAEIGFGPEQIWPIEPEEKKTPQQEAWDALTPEDQAMFTAMHLGIDNYEGITMDVPGIPHEFDDVQNAVWYDTTLRDEAIKAAIAKVEDIMSKGDDFYKDLLPNWEEVLGPDFDPKDIEITDASPEIGEEDKNPGPDGEERPKHGNPDYEPGSPNTGPDGQERPKPAHPYGPHFPHGPHMPFGPGYDPGFSKPGPDDIRPLFKPGEEVPFGGAISEKDPTLLGAANVGVAAANEFAAAREEKAAEASIEDDGPDIT